jgi:hypothetical protein
MAERAPPRWLHDGLEGARHELAAYATTTWQLLRRPYPFIDEWWRGQRTAINPLAMLATSATITGAAHQIAGAVLGVDHPETMLGAVLSALGPYLHYVMLGVLCHLALRRFQTRDARLADSVAVALFAGAGPAALAEAVGWLVLCALRPWVSPQLIGAMLGVAFSVYCLTLATSLAGLHRPPWWAMLIAFGVSFPLSGLVFGMLEPPGNYGMHWVLDVRGGVSLGLGL